MPTPLSDLDSKPPIRRAQSDIQIGLGTIAMAVAAFSMALFVFFTN